MKRAVGTPLLELADLLDRQAPDNVKQHDVPMIAASLARFGYVRRIALNGRDGLILLGHGTAQAIGWLKAEGKPAPRNIEAADGVWRVPVDWDDLAPARARAYRIADNRATELGGWDEQALLKTLQAADAADRQAAGFDVDDIRRLMRSLGESEEEPPAPELDRAAELLKKWKVKRGQLWIAGEHRILCGDCTDERDVKSLLGDQVPMLTVTDPPYGVGFDPKWRDDLGGTRRNDYMPASKDTERAWKRVWELCRSSILYVWHSHAQRLELQIALESLGYEVRSEIIWFKPTWPFSRAHYAWRHEACLYCVKKNAAAHWNGWKGEETTTAWSHKPIGGAFGAKDQPGLDSATVHAAQKPIMLMARPIANHGGPGARVYDPFLGSGTTIVAAEQLGRIGYGMEIEPKYIAVTLERLAQMGLEPRLEPASTRRKA